MDARPQLVPGRIERHARPGGAVDAQLTERSAFGADEEAPDDRVPDALLPAPLLERARDLEREDLDLRPVSVEPGHVQIRLAPIGEGQAMARGQMTLRGR